MVGVAVVGGVRGSTVVVFDGDNSEGSRAFVKTLSEASELRTLTSSTLAEAEGLVTTSKVVALIRIMPGFGEGQENLFLARRAGIDD